VLPDGSAPATVRSGRHSGIAPIEEPVPVDKPQPFRTPPGCDDVSVTVEAR
jgi:hypothetical protein